MLVCASCKGEMGQSGGMASEPRFDNLQGLRGFAALLVLVEHTANAISTRFLGVSPYDSPLAIFPFAAGVDIFFVISGFIIAFSSRSLFGKPGAWKSFLLRRLARVVPLYWLMTGVMICAFILIGSRAWSDTSWSSVAASFLFLPAVNVDGITSPILAIGWTLNYEMAFYALFAVALCFSQGIALVFIVGMLVLPAVLGKLFEPATLALQFWTNPIVLEFAAGVCLYELHRSGKLALPGIAQICLSLTALFCFAMTASEPGPWRWIVWGGPAALLVAAALGTAALQGKLARGGSRAGDWSYGIYLTHFPIVMIGSMTCQVLFPQTNWVWFGLFPVFVLIATLAAAALLYRVVERPFMDLASQAGAHQNRPQGPHAGEALISATRPNMVRDHI
ncbi:acyltransferase [Bosea sp. UNC402CLCol]|uniref:acyltransferase family protein n=1 Tax=Bosea sp. UNC402CLCol TaxID=1510531 RepID=UPI00068F1A08|nr:acyltransferase [Bosea sp. UNC402CLCol]